MRYVNITLAEMQQVLSPARGWREAATKFGEVVMEWRLPFERSTVIKVYTSVRKADWRGRWKDSDSIKVALVSLSQNRGLGKFPHVKRVEGWRDNLKSRIMEAIRTRIDQLHRSGHPPIVWPPQNKRPNVQPPTSQPAARQKPQPPRYENYPDTEEGQKQFEDDCFDYYYAPEDDAENQALGRSHGRYSPPAGTTPIAPQRPDAKRQPDSYFRQRFGGLACELSPENLTHDGELSPEEVARKRSRIMADWKALEKAWGRTVKPEDTYGW